jgi:hypothetical protein
MGMKVRNRWVLVRLRSYHLAAAAAEDVLSNLLVSQYRNRRFGSWCC